MHGAIRTIICGCLFPAYTYVIGHSAALFLGASELVDVTSFDRFDRPYQHLSARLFNRTYPGRFQKVIGDTCKTFPMYVGLRDVYAWPAIPVLAVYRMACYLCL